MAARVPRRAALRVGGALALGLPSIALTGHAGATVTGKGGVVRLASVTTVADGGLLQVLVAGFTAESGIEVTVHTGEDIYERARAGDADLVLSHLGHRDAQAFIAEGLGQWPRAVLLNQTALLAHPSDPADVRGAADPVEAFRRIAAAGAPFIVNDIEGQRYIVETMWHAVGRPDRTGWYGDTGLRMGAAARAAAEARGYTLWGLTPFLVAQRQMALDLVPVVFDDPLVQRLMVTVAVNPARVPGVNAAEALSLQEYLLTPAAQAEIRNHRYPGIDGPIFWPAGRTNATELLP